MNKKRVGSLINKEIIFSILPYAIGGVALYIFGNKIFQLIGLSESKGDKVNVDLAKGDAFNPTYWKKKYPNVSDADKYAEVQNIFSPRAKLIYDAKWGGWGYDLEDQAVAQINACATLNDLSLLSFVFNKDYNLDLHEYLVTFLEARNWITIDSYIKNKKP